MRDSEINYTTNAILKNPENESPWRYLRGLYKEDTQSWVNDSRISSLCVKVLSTKSNYVFALSMLLDLLCNDWKPSEELREAICGLSTEVTEPLDSDVGKSICQVLQHIDLVRANYWMWRKSIFPMAI